MGDQKQQDFKSPPNLDDQIDEGKLIQKHLSEQGALDNSLKQINREIRRQLHLLSTFRQLHLLASLKVLQAAYLSSSHFKDV